MNKDINSVGGNNKLPTIEQLTQTFVDALGGIDKDIAKGVVGFGGEAGEATEVESNEGHVSHVFNNEGEGMNDNAHSTPEQSTVAYGAGYNNAFWNPTPGERTEGSGNSLAEQLAKLAGGKVISFICHELPHGVTGEGFADLVSDEQVEDALRSIRENEGLDQEVESNEGHVSHVFNQEGQRMNSSSNNAYHQPERIEWTPAVTTPEAERAVADSIGEELRALASNPAAVRALLTGGVVGAGEGFADLVSEQQVEDALRRIRENEGLDQHGANS